MARDLTEKKWIQKAINPEHKGACTPMTKSTCTPRRKALARRFKKGGDMYSGKSESESFEPAPLAVLEILAVSDPAVFEAELSKIGLVVTGMVDEDPLNKRVQEERITAMATTLTDDIHEYLDDKQLKAYIQLAEDYGYYVGLSED